MQDFQFQKKYHLISNNISDIIIPNSIEQEKNSRYHLSGHGGGDWGLVTDWIKAVINQDHSLLSSTIDASVESHIMGFMAEKSRVTNQTIPVHLK